MMARLLRWFERTIPWINDDDDDSDFMQEMSEMRRQAEIGTIRAEVETENFVAQMFQDRGSSRPRLPAKSQ